MIYWHVDKKSVCIYSQLKRCSSSEVAAMIEGVLRHCTDMDVQKNYVDSHGQSEVAFAFSRLLGFELMPRLKNIKSQMFHFRKLATGSGTRISQGISKRPINWELIRRAIRRDGEIRDGVAPRYRGVRGDSSPIHETRDSAPRALRLWLSSERR